jgi:hypothetical protein
MTLRRSAATLACLSAIAGSVVGGVAKADPSNDRTLTYEFTHCKSDATGADVPDFQGVKQLSQAAAVHLLDGRGNFLFMRAEDLEGNLLFEVPGFTGRNGLPTITCLNTSPLPGGLRHMSPDTSLRASSTQGR